MTCRLYLITPPAFVPAQLIDGLSAALEAGDVASVQLRLKDADDDEVRRAADLLCPAVQEHDVAFIMNDRPDLALATGCDGVHVGQEDASYKEARRIVGDDAIIGATCHDSRHLAIAAAESGADYVAFGAFFATGTKRPKSRAAPEILEDWSTTTTIPSVAIGGITAANCAPLVQAGADFLAVVSAVWDHADGPAAGVRELNEAIERAAG